MYDKGVLQPCVGSGRDAVLLFTFSALGRDEAVQVDSFTQRQYSRLRG